MSVRSAMFLAAVAAFAIPVASGGKQLFLDDPILEKTSGLQRTMHPPAKRGPVIRPG